MDLFSASLHQHTVPLCFKAATIIPVPKKTKVKALNDYCPVALTSVVVKVLERLTVVTHLKHVTNSNMDPLQFAYRDNRYTDDAVALALHFGVSEHTCTHPVRRLQFRVQHGHLTETVWQAASMCYWIHDFLLQRSKVVKMNGVSSSTIIPNTNSPGMCPSPASLLPVHKLTIYSMTAGLDWRARGAGKHWHIWLQHEPIQKLCELVSYWRWCQAR